MGKIINFEYSCIHGSYWMFNGVAASFTTVFLLAAGYSNSEIGLFLAAANILACILQPVIADIGDHIRKITIIEISQIIALTMMICLFGFIVFNQKTTALSVAFILLIIWHMVLQPLLNSMAFKLEDCGVKINFGIARSTGSLTYAVLVSVLGILVENHGIIVIPLSGELILLALLISLCFVGHHYRKSKAQLGDSTGPAVSETCGPEEHIGLADFIRRNRMFLIVNIGVLGIYFNNAILNSYMIQVVTEVGGGSDDMGKILAYKAMLEIPAMLCFPYLRKKVSCPTLLKVGAFGFTAKVLLVWLSDSVAMVFAAQTFQVIGFGLFLTSMVHFIDEIMDKGEAVKGQAMFTTTITAATVFSSLFGGIILDMTSAETLLAIATYASAAGAVIIFNTINRVS